MLYSDYYEREFSKREIEQVLRLYHSWCRRNNLKPEFREIDTETELDHAAYHAEIEQGWLLKNMTGLIIQAVKNSIGTPFADQLQDTWTALVNSPIFLDFKSDKVERNFLEREE